MDHLRAIMLRGKENGQDHKQTIILCKSKTGTTE